MGENCSIILSQSNDFESEKHADSIKIWSLELSTYIQ